MDYSSNGTFINTERVPRDSKTILNQGDIIVFGDYAASALRYKFLVFSKESDLKRPSNDSSILGTLNSSIKKKKTTPSVNSAATSGSLHSLITMEIPDLFNLIYTMIDSSIQNISEFQCSLCAKICLFPIYFPCYHNFCFLCYSQKIYEKTTYCPFCNKKISKKYYPYRNYLLVEAMEKKLEPDVLCILRVLDDKIEEVEKFMQNQIRAKINAQNIVELQSHLPIYSIV